MKNNYCQFVKLDFFAVSSYVKFLLYFLFLALASAVFDASGIMAIILVAFLANTMMQAYLFGPEDKYGLDRLYATLPLTNKDIVVSRYISGFVLSVLIYLAFTLMSIFIALVTRQELMLPGFFQLLGITYGISFVFAAIEFPLLYRFGFSKVQFIQMVPILFGIGGILLLREVFGINILSFFSASTGLIFVIIVSLLSGILLYIASAWLSSKIRKRNIDK